MFLSPRTCQQPDEVCVRMMDMGTNTSDVEARPHRDGPRVETLDANIQTPLPIVNIMIPTGGKDQIALPQIKSIYLRIWTQLFKRFSIS